MQTGAMKACFQIAECSLSYTKIRYFSDNGKDKIFFLLLHTEYNFSHEKSYEEKTVKHIKREISKYK